VVALPFVVRVDLVIVTLHLVFVHAVCKFVVHPVVVHIIAIPRAIRSVIPTMLKHFVILIILVVIVDVFLFFQRVILVVAFVVFSSLHCVPAIGCDGPERPQDWNVTPARAAPVARYAIAPVFVIVRVGIVKFIVVVLFVVRVKIFIGLR
jgi:hypothetical protein